MPTQILLVFALIGGSAFAQSALPTHYQRHDIDDVCKQIVATAPQPPPESTTFFKPVCDSSAYYFGIGHPVDFAAARKCASVERVQPDDRISNIFRGPGVLSMLYANGEGVRRNIPLARRFACENGWAAPAEQSARLDLLDEIAKSTNPPHFDLCDTATSGLSQGWCASIGARKLDIARNLAIKRIRTSLPASAQAAFRKLQTAETEFENLRTKNEVDLSGTGRAAFALEEETSLRDQFLTNLKTLRPPLPEGSLPSLQSADEVLNSNYAKLKKALPAQESQDSEFGTIAFAGVHDTQRAWIHLRDSWALFIQTAYPEYSHPYVVAVITEQRNHQLREILNRD